MKIELSSGTVRLAPGQSLTVRDGAGSTVCAREGTLWITEEKSSRDVVLEAGNCYRLERRGLAIVQAFDGAVIALT